MLNIRNQQLQADLIELSTVAERHGVTRGGRLARRDLPRTRLSLGWERARGLEARTAVPGPSVEHRRLSICP